MRRQLMLLATLALAGACAGPGVASLSPLPAATQSPTQESTTTESAGPTFVLAEICADLERLAGVTYLGECAGVIRPGRRTLIVGVGANSEVLARELLVKYGDAIELSVGLFPYPPPEDPERACLDIRPTVIEHPPMVATVEVDREIVAGTLYEGRVRLTNAGPVPFELETSSDFSLYLFRPGASDPIGMSELGWMGHGSGASLAPGESIRFPGFGGTASCDLALGYVVPAGAYEVRALVGFNRKLDDRVLYFWSEPSTVAVVDQ